MLCKTIVVACFCFLAFSYNRCIAQQPRLVLPIGHTDVIYSAQFSPDGKKIITVSGDNTVKIWDAGTGYLLANFIQQTGYLAEARFSPDGKKIITQASTAKETFEDNQNIFKVWNAVTGDSLAFPEIHKPGIKGIPQFSRDGSKLVIISDSVRIWNIATHQLIYSLNERDSNILSVQFSPDDKWLLTVHEANRIKIRNVANGKLIRVLKDLTASAFSLGFSSNAAELTAVTGNETISWNTTTWTIKRKIQGKLDGSDLRTLTPDTKNIITASYDPADRFVKCWNAASRKLIYKIKGEKIITDPGDVFQSDSWLNGTVAAASGTTIAAVLKTIKYNDFSFGLSNDKTVKLWNAVNGKLVDSLVGHIDAVRYIQFSPEGKRIITAADDRTAKIWDAATGSMLVNLGGHTFNSRDAAFSPADKQIITTSDDGSVKLWDAVSGALVKTFKGNTGEVFSAKYSADGKKIITGSRLGTVYVFEIESGKQISLVANRTVSVDPTADEPENDRVTGMLAPEFSPDGKRALSAVHTAKINVFDSESGKTIYQREASPFRRLSFAHFSTDGKKIITGWIPEHPGAKDSTVTVWEAESGKPLYKIKQPGADIFEAAFSADSKTIFTFSNETGKRLAIWDGETGKQLNNFKVTDRYSSIAQLSSDNTKILFADMDGRIQVFEAGTGKPLTELKARGELHFAQFSPDSKKIATHSPETGGEIWDAENGTLLLQLKGHNDELNMIRFSPDSKKIISTSKDNTSKVWDASTGQCLYTFFSIDSSDYFNILPSGYYQGTPNAARKLHYVTKDLNAISFEQLDVKYNRPDKVLQVLGNTDTVLIASYRKAYEKRIKKLGIDTTAFRDGYSVPEADFVNRNAISSGQKDKTLSLHIKGTDSAYNLDRYNIWVNEVPVYGQRGISVRKNNATGIDTIITVKLSQGENRIEISVTNVNGTESYRKPLIVNYIPATKQKETTYFIGIGIDRFADAEHNLQYSRKDIRDLSAKLKEKFGGNIIIDTLFNENVTVSNVKALKQKLQQTTVNDKVIISYSGHGLLSKDFDYYLSTYSVNFNKPEENGLPYDELENLLDSIPARKKLMLIDACHSGEVDKDDLVKINAGSAAMKLTKGGIVVNYKEEENHLGLKNSFELMQNLFVNVGKSTGATIISAAGGTQFALERNDFKNGVFTYAILEAMKNKPEMKISELKKIVGARVEELTNGMQKPTSRNETIAVDWNIW